MSYLPVLSLLVVPIGALAIGAWALWLNRPVALQATEARDGANIRGDLR